jgi:glycosyltransferase involved in cell wall biosynthesis
MRVALISETFLPDVNGVAATICRILEYLQAEGHQALLFAPKGAPAGYAGAEVVVLKGATFPLYRSLRLTPPQPGIAARLREFRPDLIHLVGPVLVGALGPSVGRRLGLPVISTYHTNLGTYSEHYGLGFLRDAINSHLRRIHNGCAVTLCPSTETRRALQSQGFQRVEIWGRGVDTGRFAPGHRSQAWRAALGIQAGEVVLLYVGRLASEKRLDLLLDAPLERERVRLVLVGDGPARPDLERRFRGLPVNFLGFRRGHDLATAYASADVFVFPSSTDTFGQVVQEAMASGLPVVGASGGGQLDLIQPGETGLLFESGSGPDLRAQLNRLVGDPELRLAMGRAGRRAAERRTWPTVMAELMGHYQRALDLAPNRLPSLPAAADPPADVSHRARVENRVIG